MISARAKQPLARANYLSARKTMASRVCHNSTSIKRVLKRQHACPERVLVFQNAFRRFSARAQRFSARAQNAFWHFSARAKNAFRHFCARAQNAYQHINSTRAVNMLMRSSPQFSQPIDLSRFHLIICQGKHTDNISRDQSSSFANLFCCVVLKVERC